MKIILGLLLFISFACKSQDFKNYKNAHDFLSSTVRASMQTMKKQQFGFVLLQSVVVHGELTSIKTLYSDSKILESDATRAVQLSSGKWKFCPDSTVVIIPFSFYYKFENAATPTRYFPATGSSRPFDLVLSDEVVSGTVLPAVHCKISFIQE